MDNSLKQKVYQYLKEKYPEVIHKGEIDRLAVLAWGRESENCGRRCRELENAGLIEKIPDIKGRAMYRWVSPKVVSREQEEDEILQASLL